MGGERAGRIFIVDDDPNAIRLISGLLSTRSFGNFECVSSDSPKEALEILAQTPKPFDFIISDLFMPDQEGGMQFLAQAAEISDAPIILMTAYHEAISEVLKVIPRIKGSITKPFIPGVVFNEIRRVEGLARGTKLGRSLVAETAEER